MAAEHDDPKQHILAVLEQLPDEAVAEVARSVDYQKYKLAKLGAMNKPYVPINLEGIWEGIEISDEDIAEARREMWSRFAYEDR
jgi:hypothetical protein